MSTLPQKLFQRCSLLQMRRGAQNHQQWLAAILQSTASAKLPIRSSGSVILYTCSQDQTIMAHTSAKSQGIAHMQRSMLYTKPASVLYKPSRKQHTVLSQHMCCFGTLSEFPLLTHQQ